MQSCRCADVQMCKKVQVVVVQEFLQRSRVAGVAGRGAADAGVGMVSDNVQRCRCVDVQVQVQRFKVQGARSCSRGGAG